MRWKMAQNSSSKVLRLQVVLPLEMKEKLRRMAAGKGKKISAFVREAIEQKIIELERELYEERMREAYLGLAEENLRVMEDFRYTDAENL
jgi:predicted DNA-binding protein